MNSLQTFPTRHTRRKLMSHLSECEAAFGTSFADKTLLQRALTHRSYVNENPDFPLEDNERLEFLGDAILDFVIGE